MTDRYDAQSGDVTTSSRRAVAIAPTDGAALAEVPKALYVGTGGDITMIGADAAAGSAGVLWKNVPSGTILPFRPREIKATGTTASNILGLL